MPEFPARLSSAIETAVTPEDAPFDRPRDDDLSDEFFLPVGSHAGLALVALPETVDPHSPAAIERARQHAATNDARLFATVNPSDAFLFSHPDAPFDDTGSTPDATTDSLTEPSEFARRHYDLRDCSLATFANRLLEDAAELRQKSTARLSEDDFRFARLRSFHASLAPRYADVVAEAFEGDEGFRETLLTWAEANDHPLEPPGLETTFEIAARRYALLRASSVVFGELARREAGNTENHPNYRVEDRLADRARSMREAVVGDANPTADDAALRDDLFAAIPVEDATKRRLSEFAESLERESLSEADGRVVGRLYEECVSADERTELGQFYTPEGVGELLARWAVRSPDDRVLDPCCGAGSLTAAAVERLADLGCSRPVRRLTAIDVNEFPLRLTTLDLASRASSRDADSEPVEPVAYHSDFFDVDPDRLGRFDASVGNPPYVRQEAFAGDRERVRDHLTRYGPESAEPYADGERALDGRCDLYCYFLTHATGFLRDRARLAWIVPTKWLTADYGPSLQRFLFDHYRVAAVVGFRKRVFADALVDTVLLFAERCDDRAERRETTTNFVRVTEQLDPEDVLELVERDGGIPDGADVSIRGRSTHRTVAVRQSSLADDPGKLDHYVDAPALYTAVLEHPDTLELADVASVTRGKKTGANPIFVLDEADVRRWGVESRFRRPAIKSVREVEGFEHDCGDASRWLLDVNDYVEAVERDEEDDRSGGDTSDGTGNDPERGESTNSLSRLADRVEAELRADGYDGLLAYLRWAADQSARTNDSIAGYDPWFDLGSLDGDTAPIVCPQAMDTRRFFFATDERVVPSNRFLLVTPETADVELLLGLLNASVTRIVVESHGRVTGGGAVNLSASDLRSLHVVAPDALSVEQVERVRTGFARLRSGDDAGLDAIDDVLLDVLGLDVSRAGLQRVAETLKRRRRSRGREVASFTRMLDELEAGMEASLSGGPLHRDSWEPDG